MAEGKSAGRPFRRIRLLLIVPYIAVLWVPYYDRAGPALYGIPFFYWYQMFWIVLGVLVLIPVYAAEERRTKPE